MLKEALKQYLIKNKILKILGVVILLFLIGSRFLWLNEFPVGILHDEIDVTLSAKTYWEFGKDLSGVSFPKSLFVTNTWAYLSGLPSFILAPFYGPIDLNPLIIRLPFIIVSFLIIYFIALLVYEFTKSKKIFWISIFVALINPWLYFYSRQPTEAPFSLLFAVIGTYIMFKLKGSKMLLSLLFFLASFFSYFGAKPIIPVYLIFITILHWLRSKDTSRLIHLLFIGTSFFVVIFYLLISKSLVGNTLSQRKDQLTIFNINKYAEIVNEERRASIDFPFKDLFYNKFTVLSKITLAKFFGPYSFEYLFLSGDSVVPFEDHGVLYVVDLFFILLGITFFIKTKEKKEKTLFLIVLILLISGSVGPAISVMGNQYVFRAFLHIPAYIILISVGLSKFPVFLSVPVYLILFVNFLTFFFFRYSIKQQDNHYITERVLSKYLNILEREDKEVVVTVIETDRVYYQYTFYNNVYKDIQTLPEYREEQEIKYNKIIFTNNCPTFDKNKIFIIESRSDCPTFNDNYVVIQNQKDAGVKYRIFNDPVCDVSKLTSYRRDHLISDYNIEKMEDLEFCSRWLQNGKTN